MNRWHTPPSSDLQIHRELCSLELRIALQVRRADEPQGTTAVELLGGWLSARLVG